jgi:uncharacterized protein
VKRFFLDTGPLVALLNRADRYNKWARDVLDTIEPPVFSCEAVISEACFLLRRFKGGATAPLRLIADDVIRMEFRLPAELDPVESLMKKYASVPMSLADACLVRMTELEPQSVVLTLDSDFKIYRRNKRQVIPLVTPD